MTVTKKQKQLASQNRKALKTLFRDGLVSLLTNKADQQKAPPILARLKALLEAIGEDTNAILNDAYTIANISR